MEHNNTNHTTYCHSLEESGGTEDNVFSFFQVKLN